jgi:maltooligosyltrehalose trehalohydrolase
MNRDADGIFTAVVDEVEPGTEYFYVIDDSRCRPDPASRSQPQGVHGPSQVVAPYVFSWGDRAWAGLPLEALIIYELHTGTFTPEGTFDGVARRLPYLRNLGITALELMPVATFPGERNWGYDGVDLYAPHPAYGGPEELKRLIDACHRLGLAVILDVVYNHLGPEGNYLAEYGPYFTERYRTPWGGALNVDGAQSDWVRRFFVDNALYWLTEYHVDGLRLDAVHGIFDHGARHLLREIAEAFHQQSSMLARHAWLIAESDLNDSRVINLPAIGGHGIDAQWSDDLHHSLHTVLTGNHRGYFADFGQIADLRKALVDGFVYDGRYSRYRERHHGSSSRSNPGQQLVVFNQNHDQIANAEAGQRLHQLVGLEAHKVATIILICAPNLPMIFMGEEFGASTPFDYFTSFGDQALARAVSEGRRREYEPFFRDREFPDPQSPETFAHVRLDWRELGLSPHRELFDFYRALLSLRKSARCLSNCRKDLTGVEFSEAYRWLRIDRGDPAGAGFIFCNLADAARELPIPKTALGARLQLFSGSARFGGNPNMSSPPEVIDRVHDRMSLPSFSAAIYTKSQQSAAIQKDDLESTTTR